MCVQHEFDTGCNSVNVANPMLSVDVGVIADTTDHPGISAGILHLSVRLSTDDDELF